jgi:multidrug efflux system outer membrane protein
MVAAMFDYQMSLDLLAPYYQRLVLIAFKDVSDSLVDLNSYAQQMDSENEAVTVANRTAKISIERYRQGLINYFDVLDSERTQFQVQSHAIQIHARQLISTVHLIKAMGGGFEAAALQTKPSLKMETTVSQSGNKT